LLDKAAREAESGRRLAIHDRETGLYAYWYLNRRFEEESRRATRYDSPLSVMVVEIGKDDAYETRDEVTRWLAGEKRGTDLASHLGDGRFIVILTETGLEEAAAIAGRLAKRFPEIVEIGLGSFPEDAATLEGIKQAAERRSHRNWALAV
jgi:GGDEF domain-containing protein